MDNTSDRWVFIVNPIAGNKFGSSMVPEIERRIRENRINAEIVLTERPGHATELSRAYAAKGTKYIIAVGGDGTMNEIARPLVNNREVVVGIIPAGTGNDFIQIPGFSDRFDEAEWNIFFRRNVRPLDVGTVNDMIFLNGLGIGFDAEVAAQNYTEEGTVRKGGEDKYVWHIIKTLLFFREKKMVVITDNNHHETDCFINTVSIGRRFAGSFFLTPEAVADDGLLDVCSIKRLNLYHRFRLLLKVPKGTHITDKRVTYFRTSQVDLEFPVKVPFHVDGEMSFSKTFKVGLIPGGLNIIYNPDGDHYFSKQ
ncbi:MAG: YegS/Rv2252/BmrU family lipid kinase [Bacteroidota bacterium]|nr:YegS/Rv2252/BmrU family lipid kinase [Bacteroidota bacterium]